ncbi:MAG: hypothetical protein COB53_00335 [Elusimicrobia bacterium]|nr:MAG: hypothetical protein COB53_00335 [Elusimicrobiota bacterium]
MKRELTIATPCYNEAESLPEYFKRIESVRSELVKSGWQCRLTLIDDGSFDQTAEMIKAYAASHENTQTIHHPRNMGYGGAIKTALTTTETEWLIFVDADTNYHQNIALELVKLASDDIDIINVSLLAPGGLQGYPWYRKILSMGASGLYRVSMPRLTRGIYTMTCGFRMYRTAVAPQILPHIDNFAATTESMLRALNAGLRIVEFPAKNEEREHGISKMRFVSNTLIHFKLVLRAWFCLLGEPETTASHLRRIGR